MKVAVAVAALFLVTMTLAAERQADQHHHEQHPRHRPHPNCDADCHICETLAAPKLRTIHKMCPHCECARRLVNATIPPCPDLSESDRFCIQGRDRDARGCPTHHCAATHVPIEQLVSHLRTCAVTCAGGYELDVESGLPSCSCVCPLERVPPRRRWDYCSKQCEGRHFQMVYDETTGCQECVCEEPRPQSQCPPFYCNLFCPRGFVVDEDGCSMCQCRSLAKCPPAPDNCNNECGPEGRRRDPVTGCIVSCDCQHRGSSRHPVCPVVGCNVDCGPHKMVSVQDNGCVTGCSCQCNVPTSCNDDPHHGVCIERVRDHYGCPTCECARRAERKEPHQYRAGVQLCPESRYHQGVLKGSVDELCPNQCQNALRLFDGERNCQLCDCCPSLAKKCPNLFCEQNQIDHWGCPVCACAEHPVLREH